MLYIAAAIRKQQNTAVPGQPIPPIIETILLDPTSICAPNEQMATVLAGQKIDLKNIPASEVEFIIRPFAAK